MNISLELYKTFYYVAKNKSISRAANELLISQPAVSKSIKTLEDQLGTKLFTRTTDGMVLTDVGIALYKKIKDAMELITSAENDLSLMTNMKYVALYIGMSETIMKEHLMPIILNFYKEYPNIVLKISTEKTSELVSKLQKDLIAVVITYNPFPFPDNISCEELLSLHDCLACTNSFDHLKNKKITPKMLEKEPMILLNKGSVLRTKFDNYCTKYNIHIDPKIEFAKNYILEEFTLAGFGIGMFTEEYIKEELESGKLFKLDLEKQFEEKQLVVARNKDNRGNIIADKFVEYVKNNIKN